ncbi:transporter substrate-binding domain-containing protein [Roseateles aquatilis]|nr:transporter substrate-binding domain-containing protein [Roseateles aquatilis]
MRKPGMLLTLVPPVLALVASGLVHAHALACGPYRVGLKPYPQIYDRHGQEVGANRDQEGAGLDREFFTLLAARSGCAFVYELESQPRVWVRLREGSLDITSWAIPTEERLRHVTIVPLLTVRPMAYTWASAGVSTPRAFLARQELRAVVVKGSSYGPGFDAMLGTLAASARVSAVADVDAATRVFMAHRVDLIVTYPWVMARQLRAMPGKIEVADWHPDGPTIHSGLALSHRTVSAQDQARLLDALSTLQKDGTLKRLVDRYLPNSGVGFAPVLRAH